MHLRKGQDHLADQLALRGGQLQEGVEGFALQVPDALVPALATRQHVALEAGGQRMLVEQDGTRLEIAGEELAYHKVEAEQEIPMTNTVTVPRGKEFSLRLSDGTQVYPRIRIRDRADVVCTAGETPVETWSITYVTDGGTYVIASNGQATDSGRPRDLLAVLPLPIEGSRVVPLWPAVNPDLVVALRSALDG